MEGPAAYLAIRRCLLTERLIQLLAESPDGARLAQKLVIHGTNNRSYAFVGPDLEAVTQFACTVGRCEQQCTPAYTQHLEYFDIRDPRYNEVTCGGEKTAEEESEQEDEPSPLLS